MQQIACMRKYASSHGNNMWLCVSSCCSRTLNEAQIGIISGSTVYPADAAMRHQSDHHNLGGPLNYYGFSI